MNIWMQAIPGHLADAAHAIEVIQALRSDRLLRSALRSAQVVEVRANDPIWRVVETRDALLDTLRSFDPQPQLAIRVPVLGKSPAKIAELRSFAAAWGSAIIVIIESVLSKARRGADGRRDTGTKGENLEGRVDDAIAVIRGMRLSPNTAIWLGGTDAAQGDFDPAKAWPEALKRFADAGVKIAGILQAWSDNRTDAAGLARYKEATATCETLGVEFGVIPVSDDSVQFYANRVLTLARKLTSVAMPQWLGIGGWNRPLAFPTRRMWAKFALEMEGFLKGNL